MATDDSAAGSDGSGAGAPGPDDESRVIADRRKKLEELRQLGVNPFANGFAPTHTTAEVITLHDSVERPAEPPREPAPLRGEERYAIAGRVVAHRSFGKAAFIKLRDRAGELQVYVRKDKVPEAAFEAFKRADVGDFLGARGFCFVTKTGELTLLSEDVVFLTKAVRPLPPSWHGIKDVERRYRERYADLVVDAESARTFRLRSRMVSMIRRFLDARDFLEVETPMMHLTLGGAAARPFRTHHNALDLDLYMRIAPELHLKRLVVGGFDRVYEINRNFRNEGLSRSHNPEFTMLEFYQAYATFNDLMTLTEELFAHLARELCGGTRIVYQGTEIDLGPPWRRLSVKRAVTEIAGESDVVFEDPVAAALAAVRVGVRPDEACRMLVEALDEQETMRAAAEVGASGANPHAASRALIERFVASPESREQIATKIASFMGEDERRERAGGLGMAIFEQTAEKDLVQPTFLTDFPLAVSPLARRKDDDPVFCDRFELYIGGREMANAFSELNDPDDQRARFLAQLRAKAHGAEETMDYDEDYCRALELGMPPAAGEGIGIDRLAMLLADRASIRDVILFPLMRPEGK